MSKRLDSLGHLSVAHHAHLLEYEKLKEEQSHRIHFRDNLRYVNLAAAAVVSSYASSKSERAEAWLLVPWLTSILAWTYVMNMHQVERISIYLGDKLRAAFPAETDSSPAVFGWEDVRKSETRHCLRKVSLLFFDELTFVAPAVLALLLYAYSDIDKPVWMQTVFAVDAALAAWVFISIYLFSDDQAQLHKRLKRARRDGQPQPDAALRTATS
jgi:hypothetical protein